MTGYSWASVIGLVCYLFLFLTFLTTRKNKKVMVTFSFLQLIMSLWYGGSFAMRMQFWPSVNFWHHVSLSGILLLPAIYFRFIVDFLDEKRSYGKNIWLVVYIGVFFVNLFTGFFIPLPKVVSDANEIRFIYEYSWPIYALFVFIIAVWLQIIYLVYRYCKGNATLYNQLKPIVVGGAFILLGNLFSTLEIFRGIPIDILAGVVNALCMLFALYRKNLFKMTMLVSRTNCYVIAFLVCASLFANFSLPIQEFLQTVVKISGKYIPFTIAVALLTATTLLYLILKVFFDAVFLKNDVKKGELLGAFSRDISKVLNVDNILSKSVEIIDSALHVRRIFVMTRQEDGSYQIVRTSSPLEEKNFSLSSDNMLLEYLAQNGKCLLMRDLVRTNAYKSLWESEKQLFSNLQIECFVPLIVDNSLIGLIALSDKEEKGSYHNDDLEFLESVTAVSAIALNNALLYEKAYQEARKDELTGLYNRKYFYEILNEEFQKAKDTAIALSIINVDDFKLYNQLYGVKEGDIALQSIASIMRATVGDNGFVARINGKEFGVILPGYDIYSAKVLTERIVEQISKLNSRRDGYNLSTITVSAGICAAPYMASSVKELLDNADMAVYSVKRSGKNAILMYSEEVVRKETERLHKHISGYNEYASTIQALTATIDTKDHYTFSHSQNVAYYASELASAYGMNPEMVDMVREAGLLHDIGKIGIREDILNKPGSLTSAEYEEMKGHVENSVGIIRNLPSLDYVIPAVISHHERYDGRGYPRKLKGEDIPIMGRILCIADSFDAMISERSYKKAFSVEEALRIMKEEAGRQFDPELVPVFINLIETNKLQVRYTGKIVSAPEAVEETAAV